MITVSAPGKLMLFGEHSVVYGYPAIVTAVGQRMTVTVELSDQPDFLLDAEDVHVTAYRKQIQDIGKGDIPKEVEFVEIAVRNFLKDFPIKNGIHITTKSEFSSSFGFGSSSATVVCVMQALSELFGKKLTPKELFDRSYQTVLDVQKTGSGFDVAAAIWGGTIFYEKNGTVIEPLSIPELPLVIGYSGVKADTVALISDVKKKLENEPQKMTRIFEAITKIVRDAKQKLSEGDWQRVGTLMNFNQEYLRDLGVSTEKLEAMIAAAKHAGAWGAKLSGAGGGDCMICVTSDDKRERVKEAIVQAGGQVMDISVHTEGARVEHNS